MFRKLSSVLAVLYVVLVILVLESILATYLPISSYYTKPSAVTLFRPAIQKTIFYPPPTTVLTSVTYHHPVHLYPCGYHVSPPSPTGAKVYVSHCTTPFAKPLVTFPAKIWKIKVRNGQNKTEYVYKSQLKWFKPYWSYQGSIQHFPKKKDQEKNKEKRGDELERESDPIETTTTKAPNMKKKKK